MKRLLSEITRKLRKNGDEPFTVYAEMRNHPGWETHRQIIAELRLGIVHELLSERFTKLNPREKDSQQKAFHMTDQILQYLLFPLEVEQKRAKFEMGHHKAVGINPVTGKNL